MIDLHILTRLKQFLVVLNDQRQNAISNREELKSFLENEDIKNDKELYDSLVAIDKTEQEIIEAGMISKIRLPGEYNENNLAYVKVTSKLFPDKSITAKYTKEAADDLMELHGIDIRVELERALKTQIEIEEARIILS